MSTRRRRVGAVVVTVAVIALAGACGTDRLGPDSDTFSGLNGAVVDEVISSPVAWGKVEQEPEQTRASMAQGIVRNFIQCRAALSAYQSWMTSGQVPDVPEIPAAEHPIEPANQAIEQAQGAIASAIESGEPAQLREFLIGEASCGEWIPADPEQPNGPMIEDVVEALG